VTGYVVIFEGDDADGYSAYVPDLPGIVSAGPTRQETENLVRAAIAEHIGLLRELGRPVPEPSDSENVAIVDPSAA
jgi:predicted RNase H-like HicB family nuclease